MYYAIGVSAPSLHRGLTDSLIYLHRPNLLTVDQDYSSEGETLMYTQLYVYA